MKLMKKALSGIVLIAAMGLSAAVAQQASEPVLVSFASGETITAKDLQQYLGRRVDLKAAARNATGVETVVQEMALARALGLEGDGLGVARRSNSGDARFDDIYAHAIYTKLSPACEQPKDEAAARDFYDKNPKAFTVPTTVRLSRIMLPGTEKVDDEPAVGWLLNQVQAIAGGVRKFDEVATKAEQVYKLEAQGDLGWVVLGDDNTILRALADANPGDMVGPVPDGDFIYLFQINGKRASRILPWSDVSTTAAKRAVSYCREQAQIEIQERMFKKYGVQFDKKAIAGVFDKK